MVRQVETNPCGISLDIGRDADLREACYRVSGNCPERTRHGVVVTTDPMGGSSRVLSHEVEIPFEPLSSGPRGGLFSVDAHDRVHGMRRCEAEYESLQTSMHTFDTGNPAAHCRHVYTVSMQTYEAFRRALGRPVSWSFWAGGAGGREEDLHARRGEPLRLVPFAMETYNAHFDSHAGEICFGYGADCQALKPAGSRIIRFTSLSGEAIVHEVSHALLDGLRQDFSFPANPDVRAFHEAFACLMAMFHRHSLAGFARRLLEANGGDLPGGPIPEVASLFGQDTPSDRDRPCYDPDGGPHEPHERGGILAAAVYEAFQRVARRRLAPLRRMALSLGATDARIALNDPLLDHMSEIVSRLARQFRTICIRAVDYCPPAAIIFPDYLRALITADRAMAHRDEYGIRAELIDAFCRRGIFPSDVPTLSETELAWRPPAIPFPPLNGLALADLAFDGDPSMPADANETIRRGLCLARAIRANAALYAECGLARPEARTSDGRETLAPVVRSIRPALRAGPCGFFDFSLVAEVTQERYVPVDNSGKCLRHIGGATVLIGAEGEIRHIIRQRTDNERRAAREQAFARVARGKGLLVATPGGRALMAASRL